MQQRYLIARRVLALAVIFVSLQLAGCYLPLPFSPLHEHKPVREFQVGATTKSEVIEVLGFPRFQRKQGSVFIYRRPRETGIFLPVPGLMAPVGFNTVDYVIIQFDEQDIVKSIEGNTWHGAEDPRPRYGWLVESADYDSIAKKFSTSPKKCVLYLYRRSTDEDMIDQFTFVDYPAETVNVSLDSIGYEMIFPDGFFWWHVTPGCHRIDVSSDRNRNRLLTADKNYLPMECAAGEILFVRLSLKGEAEIRTVRLHIVPDDQGKKDVLESSLIMQEHLMESGDVLNSTK